MFPWEPCSGAAAAPACDQMLANCEWEVGVGGSSLRGVAWCGVVAWRACLAPVVLVLVLVLGKCIVGAAARVRMPGGRRLKLNDSAITHSHACLQVQGTRAYPWPWSPVPGRVGHESSILAS